jgi:hypothetical protein
MLELSSGPSIVGETTLPAARAAMRVSNLEHPPQKLVHSQPADLTLDPRLALKFSSGIAPSMPLHAQ